MEAFFSEAIKQVPGLAVLVILSWLFLKHMAEARADVAVQFKALQDQYIITLREIQAENLEARNQSRIAIQDNTQAMRSMTGEVHQLIGAIGAIQIVKNGKI